MPFLLVLHAPDGTAAASAAATEPAKPRAAPQNFDKTQLAELEEARLVGIAAQKTEFAAIWADWELPATIGATLEAKSAAALELLQRAVNAQSESEIDTATKGGAKTGLIIAIGRIQSGAKVKYLGKDDEEAQLKRFFVGDKLAQNDAQLLNIADAVLLIVKTETLPGVKADKIAALAAARAAFEASGDSQGLSDDSSEGLRARAAKMYRDEVYPDRRKIQLAIDAEYPYRDLDNREIRKTFDLPPAQPFA